MKFQEQETLADFEYTARNYVNEIFSAKQELELIEYFKKAAELHCGVTIKETFKTLPSAWQRYVIVLPEWVKK
jgi:hypothetical protein